jgi:excisionase family DNA binding protein
MNELCPLLTVEEAAQYARVQPRAVYRWIRLGKLPARKVGRRWLLDRDDVLRLGEPSDARLGKAAR